MAAEAAAEAAAASRSSSSSSSSRPAGKRVLYGPVATAVATSSYYCHRRKQFHEAQNRCAGQKIDRFIWGGPDKTFFQRKVWRIPQS